MPNNNNNQSFVGKALNSASSAVGSFTGTVMAGAGNGVQTAGRNVGTSINGATLGWADMARSYGNQIKDSTAGKGPRAGTAQNPLGLTRTPQSVDLERRAKAAKGPSKSYGSASDPLGLNRL